MDLSSATRVLVTGASRGIGEAIARAFAARGCTLGLLARSTDQLERLAASLPGEGHMALEGDVADAGSIAGAVERFGEVDVLVANAGITHYMPFAELPLEKAEQMDRVNWLGTLYTVKAALPGMLERGRGHAVGQGVVDLRHERDVAALTRCYQQNVRVCRYLCISQRRKRNERIVLTVND